MSNNHIYHAEAYAVDPTNQVFAQAIPSNNVSQQSSHLGNQYQGSYDGGDMHQIGTDLDPEINESGLVKYLQSLQWPAGLVRTFINNLRRVPLRYFIVDDSGSMQTQDGHMPSMGKRSPPVSRWSELVDSMKFHLEVSKESNCNSVFRLLNGAPPLAIGGNRDIDNVNYATLNAVLNESPQGMTPLCAQIRAVIGQIQPLAGELRRNRQYAVVVIASDGEASDGNIVDAMRPLENLPVWVVIKLCTDDDRIVSYWNQVDNQLEVQMDVLDDFMSEAEEVNASNPWLNYLLPLHRIREFGLPTKEFDLLDETLLSHDQASNLVRMIVGGESSDYPNMLMDFAGFFSALKARQAHCPILPNPRDAYNRKTHWISESKFRKAYGPKTCTIS